MKKEKEKNLEEYIEILELEKKQKKDAKAQVLTDLATKDKDASEIIRENSVNLKRSSARIKSKIENPDSAYNADDYDYNMFDEDLDELGKNIDPFENAYKEIEYVNVKNNYIDNNPNIKKAFIYNAGYTTDIHYKYMLDSAFDGIDMQKPT
ncbi:hypothetical protein AYI69_g10055 [Smittium culicis]|uniref:Uncharacterized protein n=1 Tax=Smittium culicis TaxID=133412 RepID=A0A1R1X8E0_9FUNG|nr:hypothetical protein AYI69_g10055 [Smittium culicis]